MSQQIYDLIGDIHGHGISLVNLLQKLGYGKKAGVFQHPDGNLAVYLGDFIDRGPTHRIVIDTVRPMVDQGSALAVMGNHEFNAVCYNTPAEDGGYLRERTVKNEDQHLAFLETYPDTQERDELVNWFKTLPMWLDLPTCRVVHACWYDKYMDVIKPLLDANNCLTDATYVLASDKSHPAYEAVEIILKGIETKLPNGLFFLDEDGHKRHNIRTKWWDNSANTYATASVSAKIDSTDKTPEESRPGYQEDAKPLFIGHYWRKGEPELLMPNVVCLDYSIAVTKNNFKGKLVAYRMRPGEDLHKGHFYWVE